MIHISVLYYSAIPDPDHTSPSLLLCIPNSWCGFICLPHSVCPALWNGSMPGRAPVSYARLCPGFCRAAVVQNRLSLPYTSTSKLVSSDGWCHDNICSWDPAASFHLRDSHLHQYCLSSTQDSTEHVCGNFYGRSACIWHSPNSPWTPAGLRPGHSPSVPRGWPRNLLAQASWIGCNKLQPLVGPLWGQPYLCISC